MIMNFEGVNPKISENTYISESVDIIGNVVIEENANIWFGSRLRADMNQIVVGANTNIQKNTIIGAGSLVTQGKSFPEGVLILGNPAKVVRELTDDEIKSIKKSADNYVNLSKRYKK